MKRELALTGIALVVSILLSSPSLAQTQPANMNAKPTPAPVVVETETPTLDDMPLDEAILYASSPEDRARLMMRCAGPPPRKTAEELASLPPASEPAVIAQ